MTHLRQIMLEELQRRNYSEATIGYYVRKVEAFARHFHCSPDGLGPQHIREYQAYLFTSKLLSSSLGESKFQVFAWSHLLSRREKRRALRTNLYRWTWGLLPGANCG